MIEHRRRRLVGKQRRGRTQPIEQPLVNRAQQEACTTSPSASVERSSLTPWRAQIYAWR
jgi:hypothetical protein